MIVVACGVMALPVAAQGIYEVIAEDGDAAPDANGAFSSLTNAALNDAGQAAFWGMLTGTSGAAGDDTGLFLGSGAAVTQIVREGQMAPDSDGTFANLQNSNLPAINGPGQVAFYAPLAGTSNDEGVFIGSGGAITQVARKGQDAPDEDGVLSSFSLTPALNDAGQAAFRATLTSTAANEGVFLGSGGALTQIARKDQAAPDANGAFSGFSDPPALNEAGQAAFIGTLTGTSGIDTDNEGVFLGSGGALTTIARKGQAAPDANGAISAFDQSPALNDAGQAAFIGTLTGTSGGTADNKGVFLGAGGALTTIARKGQLEPDGNGTFDVFNNLTLNNAGQVGFQGTLTGTIGGMADNKGVFLGSGGALTTIARAGQPAPDGNGTFSSFTLLAINDDGQAILSGTLVGTVGGGVDNSGLFLANGIDLIQVARKNQPFDGALITNLTFAPGTFARGAERSGMNQSTQLAFLAFLNDNREVILRFTIPPIHWVAAGGGDWATSDNWTTAIAPNSFHDVFIDPDAALTVTGPTGNRILKSVTIGGAGPHVATLLLNGASAGDVQSLNDATITGSGELVLANGRAFSAPALGNSGVIRGDGAVGADLTNQSSGEVRVTAGQSLTISGDAHTNAGVVEAVGGTIRFVGELTNNASALITGQNATLRFDGGLSNSGALALSLGTSNIHGDIDNNGTVVVTGNSNAIFFDDIDNNGTVNVSLGSAAVFFGAITGNGVGGGGTIFPEGDLAPGASAGLMTFGGDVHFGALSNLNIELGGDTPGSQYDTVDILGDASLSGRLTISLMNDFVPEGDDVFELLTAGDIAGAFSNVVLPTLPAGLAFELLYDSDAVTLAVVSSIPGDADGDGDVDLDDYNILSGNMYQVVAGGWSDGDFNDDGVVNFEDFVIQALHFGEGGPGETLDHVPVPEPASAIVLSAGALLLWRRRCFV